MRALAVVVLIGCAQSGKTLPPDALLVDSTVVDTPDVPPLQTLSQTTSPVVEALVSRACLAGSGTAANNYYRVFDLAAFGITTDFHVYKVSFGVEHCHELVNSLGVDVVVRLGLYDGTPGDTLALSAMTVLTSTTVHVPEVIETIDPPFTPGATVDALFDEVIPAGSKLIVEIDTPNGSTTHKILLGANNDGESAPGYLLAPQCGFDAPGNISMLGMMPAPVHLLMTVSGTY